MLKYFDKKELFLIEDILKSYIGTDVWLTNNERGWAKIVGCSYNSYDGLVFEWEQYDIGPDITELYDDGLFGLNDIGITVFFGEEAEQKCKETQEFNWEGYEW